LEIFRFSTAEPVGRQRVQQVVKLAQGPQARSGKKLSKTVRDQIKKVTVAIQGGAWRVKPAKTRTTCSR